MFWYGEEENTRNSGKKFTLPNNHSSTISSFLITSFFFFVLFFLTIFIPFSPEHIDELKAYEFHNPAYMDIPDYIETDGADGHSGSSKLENDAENSKEEKYEKDTHELTP